MNLVFLLFIFLFIGSSYATCRFQDFKLPLESNDCLCNDISHSPKGRIFNGIDLDSRDLLYIVALYMEYFRVIGCQLHFLCFFKLIFLSLKLILLFNISKRSIFNFLYRIDHQSKICIDVRSFDKLFCFWFLVFILLFKPSAAHCKNGYDDYEKEKLKTYVGK